MNYLRRLLLIGICLPQVFAALPGELEESNFPIFSAQASVSAAAVAEDGSVFIAGEFSSVDGVEQAGLAKLTATGNLDASFVGLRLEDSGFQPWFPSANDATPQPALFALPGGRLMQLGRDSWTLHNANGSPNVAALADFPRAGSTPPRPQFVKGSQVFIIGGSPRVIRAYRTDDLSQDLSFQMQESPRPAWQTVPAADGKLWVLGRSPALTQSSWSLSHSLYSLFRLEADGDLDLTFTTRELPEQYSYSLTSAADGGFRLISDWLERYSYWPSATGQGLKFQRFDASGALVATFSQQLPFGWSSRELVFQAPDRVIYPNNGMTRLLRSQPLSFDPDPAFNIVLAAPESPVLGPVVVRTLDEFPDGKLLVGGIRKMLANGTADGTWHVPRLERNATVSKLVKLADGSLLAVGDFDRADGAMVSGVVRLLADDSLDAGFSTDHDFRFATKISEFPDGSLLAFFSVPASDSLGRQSQLARFSAVGTFISLWPVPDPPGSATFYYGHVTDFAIQSDGTTLVTTYQNSEVPMVGFSRIEPNGSGSIVSSSFTSSFNSSLLVLSDDSYLLGNVRFAADGTLLGPLTGISDANPAAQLADGSVVYLPYWGNSRPQKWHPVTGVDAAFAEAEPGKPSILAVTAAAHDKMFATSYSGFVRLHSSGQLDPTFRPPTVNVSDFLATGNGHMLIAGSFEAINGEPRSGIARLADTRAVGFDAWMLAASARSGLASGSLAASADADQDGSSNLLEYAAGTDPLGEPAAQPRLVSGVTWRLPCNPEAPEISRRLETSNNLIEWRAARGDEVRVEINGRCLTWTLLPGAGKIFTRVRVE